MERETFLNLISDLEESEREKVITYFDESPHTIRKVNVINSGDIKKIVVTAKRWYGKKYSEKEKSNLSFDFNLLKKAINNTTTLEQFEDWEKELNDMIEYLHECKEEKKNVIITKKEEQAKELIEQLNQLGVRYTLQKED